MKRSLALDSSFLSRYGDLPSVFGFDIAVGGILDALMRYSSYDRFFYFQQPGALPLRRPDLPLERELDVRIEYSTRIPEIIGSDDIVTWFQPDTETEPVKYRNAFASRPFPFTSLVHNAFSPQMVRTHYLWLLLDGFAPCDSFICTSRAVRNAVCKTLEYVASEMELRTSARMTYRGRLDVLPLGVDTDRFQPMSRVEARRKLGWSEDPFTILWFGRFSAIDKTDLLPALRMFRRLVEANPTRQLRFVLAGNDHKYAPFIPSITMFATCIGIAEHILVLDNVSQEEREYYFAAADVFTSPCDNHQETFGMTPIEAMASGTPQVVSDWDGYKDTVEHGVTGFRIPTYWTHCDSDPSTDYGLGGRGYQGFMLSQSVAVDLVEYQAAMQRLIDNPELLASMGVASRNRAVQTFSWKTVIGAYEELWSELHDIAGGLRPSDLLQAPFARMEVCQRFASYPTTMLDDSQRFSVTEDGLRLLAGSDPFPWHSPNEGAVIDAQLRLALLEAVREEPGSLSEVAARFDSKEDAKRSVVARALMWGLKHGLMELTWTAR